MTFLNPLVLFGLAAAAIPILLHLLNLRKLATVEFSTLRFLHELQRTRMRRLRIRQWILLALRTLLVIFLVLAFSRPAVRTSLAGLATEAARSTMVIILDDSPSMALRNQQGVLFDQARDIVTRVAGLARAGDEIHLLRLSQSANLDQLVPSGADWSAARAAQELRVSQRSLPYHEIMKRAHALASASPNAHREIYLITDGQGTHLTLPPHSADTTGVSGEDRLRLFWISLPHSTSANVAVTDANVENQMLARDKPMTVQATLRNYGQFPLANTVASLYLDGVRVAQRSVSLPAQGGVTVSFTAVPKRRGAIGGYVQSNEDALEIDNRRFFTLSIPDRIGILLAGTVPEDTRYARVALTLEGDSSVAGLFTVRQTTVDRLALAGQDHELYLLANVRELTPDAATRIIRAVQNGAGLMIFPGSDTDADALNRTLLVPLGVPPVSPAPPDAGSSTRAGFLRFASLDRSHPLFAGLFESARPGEGRSPVESPRIQRAITMRPGRTGTTIITLTDGRPFLCEYRNQRGRILVFAVDAGMAWSDFPLKGIFAPLLYRSVLYLTAHSEDDQQHVVGDRVAFTLQRPRADRENTFSVVSPSGVRELVRPRSAGDGGTAVCETSPTDETGIFALYAAGQAADPRSPLQTKAVNVWEPESDLTPATEAQQEAFWYRYGIAPDRVTVIPSAEAVVRSVEETRFGVELWRLFLLLAVACALAEMAIARVAGPRTDKDPAHA